MHIFEGICKEWKYKEYHFLNQNCNHFTNAVLIELGAEGLDRQYLDAGGLRTFGVKCVKVAQDGKNQLKKVGQITNN